MKVKPAKYSGEVVLEMNRRDESLLSAAATAPFLLKKILVPIDFSDCSKKALQYAIPLAKQHGAELTLVYVAPSPPYASGEYGVIDYTSIEADMRASGQNQLKALVEDLHGIPAETTVRCGSAAHEIIDTAKEILADLIVISTHGRTGLQHILLGSVAEYIVRYAPCPVLVVREREHEFLAI